jgi:hypothetical protein
VGIDRLPESLKGTPKERLEVVCPCGRRSGNRLASVLCRGLWRFDAMPLFFKHTEHQKPRSA